jgi:hypothetical protein
MADSRNDRHLCARRRKLAEIVLLGGLGIALHLNAEAMGTWMALNTPRPVALVLSATVGAFCVTSWPVILHWVASEWRTPQGRVERPHLLMLGGGVFVTGIITAGINMAGIEPAKSEGDGWWQAAGYIA